MTSSIKPRDQCPLSPAGLLPGIGTWRQPGARWHWRLKLMAGACPCILCAACASPRPAPAPPAGARWYGFVLPSCSTTSFAAPVSYLLLATAPMPGCAVSYVMFLCSLSLPPNLRFSYHNAGEPRAQSCTAPSSLDLTRDETRRLSCLRTAPPPCKGHPSLANCGQSPRLRSL
jgi:hypothetical protein